MIEQTRYTPGKALMKGLMIAAMFGGAVIVAGLFLAPQRIWPNFLLANYYLLSLGLAGITFVALTSVSNAGWHTVFRRVPESMASVLPLSAVLMLALVFGISTLYEWSHGSALAHDHLLQGKSSFLNVPFFMIRMVLYFVLWIGMSSFILKTSREQDDSGDTALTGRQSKFSALFLVVFGLTFWLAGIDWIMSLEPHWYSTIFGLYNYAGMLLNGLATICIIVIVLKRKGVFGDAIRDDHLHDLGKLLFAFSTFWMYIWFSQYMLIWYANIPEETVYFVAREHGAWLTFSILNVGFNWIIPFITLISATAKKKEGLLLRVSIIIMIGHWIDLFWMILPPFMRNAPEVGIWEIGPIVAAISVFFLLTLRTLAKRRVVPVNDPMLVESMHYHA